MNKRACVFQDWILDLTMQMQSVLMLPNRGPDGIEKFHPAKPLICHYRACVLKAAQLGRALKSGEGTGDNTFMTLQCFDSHSHWGAVVKTFFDAVDALPHHAYQHITLGAEIIGYKHPDPFFRARWCSFYLDSCDNLHRPPETEAMMDKRLNDWGQRYWSPEDRTMEVY